MLWRVPPDCDVLIMGGGPGGSTLAASLARKKNPRVDPATVQATVAT